MPPGGGTTGPADPATPPGRGVEKWSRWAAGLGLPRQDRSGGRRYAERLFPPVVWLVAALGVAVSVGLLTGVLVAAPGSGSGNVQTSVATTTVTVTDERTTTATATTTRTRTRTVTVAPQVQDTAPNAPAGQSTARNGQTTAPGGRAGGETGSRNGTQRAGQGLAPGSRGIQVFVLQQALGALGLLQGPPNGTYDDRTRAAVQNFQARAGVTADPPGVAGPATLEALRQLLGGRG